MVAGTQAMESGNETRSSEEQNIPVQHTFRKECEPYDSMVEGKKDMDKQALTTSSFLRDEKNLDSYSIHREFERSFSLPTPTYTPWPPHGYTIEDMVNPNIIAFLNEQADLDYQKKDRAFKLRLHRQRDYISPEDHDLYIHIPSISEGMLLEKYEFPKLELKPFEFENLTPRVFEPIKFELKDCLENSDTK